ncbi:alpha-tectorin-like [Gymnodraco acuticeps]|uniref:Alpha-tectorin-like n=1 Tax=Gymnodraco acuticeps TaxID=8218 RepID=A0A6P8UZE5_GYMAC|nr:alpha-tectorin-like [Gymnodraco acuticeps]
MKLLLLLAVAASQMELSASETVTLNAPGGNINISDVPITFYGKTYTWLHVKIGNKVEVCLKNDPSEDDIDCVVTSDGVVSTKLTYSVDVMSFSARSDLVNINTQGLGLIDLTFYNGQRLNVMELSFFNHGLQAACFTYHPAGLPFSSSLELSTKVGGTVMDTWKPPARQYTFRDLSGCRVSGGAVMPGSEMPSAEPCSVELCSLSAVLSNVTACEPEEVCQADNTCAIPPVVCTVTGSTVIGFHGAVHSVQDRCAYSLMEPEGSASFNLTAAFRERRRTDVPLLDHLILSLPGVTMYLEQGGRVRVGGEALVLNSTAQLMHGVELSKDQTGVTAKFPSSNMTLFFDGNSAHVAGLPEAVEGLCGSPSNSSWTTSLTAEKSSVSLPGCEIQSQDSVDSTINCNRSTDHCNLMRQPPFSACHEHTDPEPYISACTHTLCRYPSVDGVDCHFLEAYAKTCSLDAKVTLEDWRSTTGCSPPPLCQQPCSDHEFCGAQMWSSSRCFCRAGFASKYRATKSLGEPPVCRQGSATVTLAGCLLAEKGIDFSTLHLKDPSCKGHMDPQSHLVTFSFDSNTCGTEVMKNGSQIVYENSIVLSNRSSAGVITRQDQLKIDFSCFYKQPEVKSVPFTIRDSSVVQHIVSGKWSYTLTMKAFSDAGLLQPVGPKTEILLNQKVWLQLDANMVAMVTDSCWATNQASPDDSLRYDLIINGCPNPADDTVQMQGNGQGTSSVFSFNMFEFSGASSEIYLHCKLELCPTQGQACTPSCGGAARRRRRSAIYADGNAALITMGWRN